MQRFDLGVPAVFPTLPLILFLFSVTLFPINLHQLLVFFDVRVTAWYVQCRCLGGDVLAAEECLPAHTDPQSYCHQAEGLGGRGSVGVEGRRLTKCVHQVSILTIRWPQLFSFILSLILSRVDSHSSLAHSSVDTVLALLSQWSNLLCSAPLSSFGDLQTPSEERKKERKKGTTR